MASSRRGAVDEGVQVGLALLTYLVVVAVLTVATGNLATSLVAMYIVSLAARSVTGNAYTRTLTIVSSVAILPLTPLITTPPGPARLPLPLHTLLTYTPPPPHPRVETSVLALDWGQVGAITLLAEYLATRKRKQ